MPVTLILIVVDVVGVVGVRQFERLCEKIQDSSDVTLACMHVRILS